jgi:hypothetical protein
MVIRYTELTGEGLDALYEAVLSLKNLKNLDFDGSQNSKVKNRDAYENKFKAIYHIQNKSVSF